MSESSSIGDPPIHESPTENPPFQRQYTTRHSRERGCNPIGIHRPSLHITPSRRRPGSISQPAGRFPRGTVAENVQTQWLVEAWIPAFAGTAREAHIKIVTMLLDTNWITASKAGTHAPALRAPQAAAMSCPNDYWVHAAARWAPACAG